MTTDLTIPDALVLDGPALSAAVAEVVYGATWRGHGPDSLFQMICVGGPEDGGWYVRRHTDSPAMASPHGPHADANTAERALRRACETSPEAAFDTLHIAYSVFDREWSYSVEQWHTSHPSLAVVLSRTALVVALSRRGER